MKKPSFTSILIFFIVPNFLKFEIFVTHLLLIHPELGVVWQLFLLGRGELFHTFIKVKLIQRQKNKIFAHPEFFLYSRKHAEQPSIENDL
jgi:hypothetical protein